jgi:hypothetical protein
LNLYLKKDFLNFLILVIKKFLDFLVERQLSLFSVDEVYALAEFVRRQRGGAAIVMGSLSPKNKKCSS